MAPLPYQLHQKLRQSQVQTSSSSLSILKGLPFWIWDQVQHTEEHIRTNGQCCFNHAVGLPVKDKKEFPLFDYEKLLYDTLMSSLNYSKVQASARGGNTTSTDFKDKHLWCLKSTGLGVSEFFLRLMAWLCTSTDDYKNSQMVVVTGPNLSLAVKLMKRLKGIFASKLGIYFTNKETMLELNGCQIEAYPSNHIDSFRSLTNPKFILLDEADFWIRAEVDEVRDVAERYIGKSDPYIAMISTPHQPGGRRRRTRTRPRYGWGCKSALRSTPGQGCTAGRSRSPTVMRRRRRCRGAGWFPC